MPHTKNLSLPSIQFLLPLEEERKSRGHRSSQSMSSLPSELQQLSLSGPNIPQKQINLEPPSPPVQLLSEALNQSKPKWVFDEKKLIERDEKTGKYYCPYCEKAFNRPSSLRIHTYSHTGEKPFICSKEGCGRTFSVQSNMRRHLRVHKIGRSFK
ncbi:unnamed protein product [Rhizopus stolonifer]